MRRGLAIVALAVCLWGQAALAGAEELVVGVENIPYRPFYTTEYGRYISPAREILDAFGKTRGVSFVYRPLPVNRLYREFLAGGLDFKFPDNPAWKSQEKQGLTIAYSDPVMHFIDGVMVLPQNKGAGLAKLKVLGTVLGFTPWKYLDLIDAGQVKLVENGLLRGLLQQAILGRIDGAYVNPGVASYQLEHVLKAPGALVFDPGLPHIEGSYLLSTLKHDKVIQEFNAFLRQEKSMVQEIWQRHHVDLQP
ncbi:MAG: hypothetical protein KQJ78_10775 [Deltaproteobacteria bacterium]|nr:hypothetical protein [Deltaproteobacteria bacterium]